jgi:hypothetical protein
VTVAGGGLEGDATNSQYSGAITLMSGIVALSTGNYPLGHGMLTLRSASTVTIAGEAGNATLDNIVNLQGGTLYTGGELSLDGNINVLANSEIQTALNSSGVNLKGDVTDNGTGSTLTLASAGSASTSLLGALTSKVAITGNVVLEPSFKGNKSASLTLTAASSFLTSTGVPNYVGIVNVQAGQVFAKGNDALGTGELDLGSAGQVVNLLVGGGSTTLKNKKVVLADAIVTVTPQVTGQSFALTVTGAVTMAQGSEIDPGRSGTITFNNTSTMTGALSLDGAGTVDLGGKLEGNSKITVLSGKAKLLKTFKGKRHNVIAKGGKVV